MKVSFYKTPPLFHPQIISKEFKIVFVLCAVIFLTGFSPAVAQDSTDIPVEIFKLKDRSEDKIMFGFVHSSWLNLPREVEVQVPSFGFNFYFFSDYQFGKSLVSFAWGLGLSNHNVHSNAAFEQIEPDNYQALIPFEKTHSYETNKFSTTIVELPIEFRLITKGKHPFKLAVGARGGYLIQSKWKIEDPLGKRKYFDYENINKFRYGVSGRIGIGWFQLTGFYALSTLFEEGKGTELYPFAVGLAVTPIK